MHDSIKYFLLINIDPFDSNSIDGSVGGGSTSSSTEEEDDNTTTLAIILPITLGLPLIIVLLVFCYVFEWFKKAKHCFGECFECCLGGCIGILKLFDIRRCFKNQNNGYVHIYIHMYVLCSYMYTRKFQLNICV